MAKEYIDKEKFKHLFKVDLDYESPIRLIETDIYTQMRKQQENDVFEAILKYGIDVDKEELIKALKYDRGQYEKGYADAMAAIVHCKDCSHYKYYRKTSLFIDGKNIDAGWCMRRTRQNEEHRMLPDDFCSHGERKE